MTQAGKSFAAKREMTNAFLITDDDIIICDPEAEYFSLVQRLDGQVIRLSPTGKGIDGNHKEHAQVVHTSRNSQSNRGTDRLGVRRRCEIDRVVRLYRAADRS